MTPLLCRGSFRTGLHSTQSLGRAVIGGFGLPTAGSGGGKEMEATRPTHLSFDEHSTALLSSFFSLESFSLS